MRIVLTVTNDLSGDRRMARICGSLAGAGHDVTLIGRHRFTSIPLAERPYRQERLDVFHEAGKLFYAEFNVKLYAHLRRRPFDVVCAVDLDTLPAAFALSRPRPRRLVLDAHEWFSETPEVVGRPLIRATWRQVGRRLAPTADLRYTVAPILAEKLAEDYGCPFATIRNAPVSGSPTTPPDPPQERIILYQGALNPGRGIEELLTALPLLPSHYKLHICGTGPLFTETARRSVSDPRLRGRVVMNGFVPPDQLPDETRRAWLGTNLLAARSPSYYYSLANKSLDYLHAGLPSLQMNFPEYRAIDAHYGCYHFVPELSGKAVAEAILSLGDERWRTLRQGCLKAAGELNWAVEERKLLRLYAELGDET